MKKTNPFWAGLFYLGEIDFAGVIEIEHFEDMIAELISLSLWIECLVRINEPLLIQLTLRTILNETFVPLVYFFAGKWGVRQKQRYLRLKRKKFIQLNWQRVKKGRCVSRQRTSVNSVGFFFFWSFDDSEPILMPKFKKLNCFLLLLLI